MSDKHDKKPPAPEAGKEGGGDAAPAKKGGLNVKLIGIVAGIMVAEGALVYFIASATGPKPVAADVQQKDGHDDEQDQTVEIPLLEDRFQNMQSGRAYIWDASIVLKVRKKDEEFVTTTLKQRAAEVKEGVALIFRRAPHNQLLEPGLETVNRQVTAYLNEVIEHDSDEKPRVIRVIIPKCKGFPAE